MFTGIDGEGPFGGSGGDRRVALVPHRRIFQVFAKAGGIGIADHVYAA